MTRPILTNGFTKRMPNPFGECIDFYHWEGMRFPKFTGVAVQQLPAWQKESPAKRQTALRKKKDDTSKTTDSPLARIAKGVVGHIAKRYVHSTPGFCFLHPITGKKKNKNKNGDLLAVDIWR